MNVHTTRCTVRSGTTQPEASVRGTQGGRIGSSGRERRMEDEVEAYGLLIPSTPPSLLQLEQPTFVVGNSLQDR